MPSLGPMELGIILLIVIVIFGAGKLPEIGGALGKSIREFKQQTTEPDDEETVAEVPAKGDLHRAEKATVAKDETVRS